MKRKEKDDLKETIGLLYDFISRVDNESVRLGIWLNVGKLIDDCGPRDLWDSRLEMMSYVCSVEGFLDEMERMGYE